MNGVQAHDTAKALAEELRNADTPLGIAFRQMEPIDQTIQTLDWVEVLLKVK